MHLLLLFGKHVIGDNRINVNRIDRIWLFIIVILNIIIMYYKKYSNDIVINRNLHEFNLIFIPIFILQINTSKLKS